MVAGLFRLPLKRVHVSGEIFSDVLVCQTVILGSLLPLFADNHHQGQLCFHLRGYRDMLTAPHESHLYHFYYRLLS